MSKPGRTSRSGTANRPRTAPRRLSSATGGGDAVPINLDDELQTVLRKEYDDGEHGKKEAISDVKAVLNQVAQDPMAKQMDQLLPRFLSTTPPRSAVPEDLSFSPAAQASRSKSKSHAPPRHAKLTARPSTAGGKSGYKVTEERPSVPNISHEQEDRRHDDSMITRITSAPTIAETRRSTTSSSISSVAPAPTQSSKRKSRSSKTVESTTTEQETQQHERNPITTDVESALSTTTIPTTGREVAQVHTDPQLREEETDVPFTENLLEITSDTEEADEIWKSDIVELTRIKSAPKGKSYSGPDSLELKYKEPRWPHQLFLNQILARHPCLTHLVLDGSELRFLRDLGSSLQSLITLSICECGLRSLDGIYGMPNLRTLIARKNMISIPTQLSFLRKLCYVDLSSNPIDSADEFGSLRHCGELRILKLYDTPLAIKQSNFNKEIKRLVPQLKEIHPSIRLYDLIGMPNLMVRSQQIPFMNTVEEEQEEDDHQKPGQKQRESKQTRGATTTAAATAAMKETKTNIKKGKSGRNIDSSAMPSLAYDDVMVDQPKPGIAYQKIETNKTLKEREQEQKQKQSEIKDVSLGTGDFSGYFMAPKFLQHLEEAMPPSTAEDNADDDDDKEQEKDGGEEHGENQKLKKSQQSSDHRLKQQQHYPRRHESVGGAGDAANLHHDEILYQQNTSSEEDMFENDGRNVPRKKKSDRGIQQQDHQRRRRHHHHRQQQQQHSSSNKNHPRGDGDSGCY